MNSHKVLLAFSLATTLTCQSLADAPSWQDNQGISNWYCVVSEQLVNATARGLASDNALVPFQTTHRAIKLIGLLRCRKACTLLLDNLGYTPWQPQNSKGVHAFTNFNFFAAMTGERMSLSGRYPAVAAILHIGVPFQTFSENIKRYEGYEKDEALSLIGLGCSGHYYFRYAQSTLGNKAIFFPVTKMPPPYSIPRELEQITSYGGIDICGVYVDFANEYDALQRTLLNKFGKEKIEKSSNLPDTIATMGFVRSLDAIPILADNLTICPQVSTNSPGSYVFPAAEALISIGPAIGDCFDRLKATKPLSLEESLWLRISHELYPEGLEYELFCAAATNDTRAARLLQSLPWRRLTDEDIK